MPKKKSPKAKQPDVLDVGAAIARDEAAEAAQRKAKKRPGKPQQLQIDLKGTPEESKDSSGEPAGLVGLQWDAAAEAGEFVDPYGRDPRFRDFRNFLYHCWTSLGIRPPTSIQYDIALWLQHGPDRLMVEAFRGVGKSWMTAAFVTWTLYWDPDKKVLIVSGAKRYADNLTTFILQIIRTVPGMAFLDCVKRERHSKLEFDVGPAKPHKQPSVTAMGITGQLTGSRADLIVPDDVETQSNSLTEGGREKISELIKEFDAILLPGGRIVYLGTPQTELSIYNELGARGYAIREWPAEYPTEHYVAMKGTTLAPMLLQAVAENPGLAGTPTEPERFNAEDLEARRMSYGRSGYARQFLLDVSGDDALRYPLKLKDLIVFPCKGDAFPDDVQWQCSSEARTQHANVGLRGDGFYEGRLARTAQYMPFTGSIMFVDPAGAGADETAYAVGRMSHGRICVPECSGLMGGYTDTVMIALAEAAKRYKVNTIYVESNFGDGMFTKLLQPHVQRIWPCLIEEIRAKSSKEQRIIETLEPIMNQHRLVIDPSVIDRDGHRDAAVGEESAARYRLFHQMTRITRERGCLAHDDRIDALAGMVQCWLEMVAKDVKKSIQEAHDAAWLRESLEFTADLYDLGKPRKSRSAIASNRAVRDGDSFGDSGRTRGYSGRR